MHNHLEPQRESGRPAMAGMLLCLAACTSLMGCLIPQDDQVIPELPPRKNTPPRIVATSPGINAKFFTTASCAAMNKPFSVTVADDDDDNLRSMWFIDYEPPMAAVTPFIPNAVPPTPGAPARVVSEPTAQNFKSAMANLTAGTHLLSVYVADREFQEFNGLVLTVDRQLKVGDASVTDFGYVDSFTWVVKVEPCP